MIQMKQALVEIFSCLIAVVQAFEPQLTVERCTRDKLIVKVTNATDGGIIYIQGQGENCKQVTSADQLLYEFDFATCSIEWELLFRIVVQKNAVLQTGHDKRIPIFCIADTQNIVASNFIGAGDKFDDDGLNKTVKPVAHMRFYKQMTEPEVSGLEVKLSDRIVMSLQLEDKYAGDFDIKARHCIASGLVIIENYCSPVEELFGNFYKFKQGHLLNEFDAFRTTTFDSGSVIMNFSCVLELCKGFCQPDICGDVYDGWGRKRRSNALDGIKFRIKRDEDENTIDVGGSVHIVDKYSEIRVITNNDFCWELGHFIVLVTFLAISLLTASVVSTVLYRKLRTLQRRLVEIENHPSVKL